MSGPTKVDRSEVDTDDDEPTEPATDGGHTVPAQAPQRGAARAPQRAPNTAQQIEGAADVANWARENPWTAAAAAGLLYAGYQFVSPNSVEVGEVGDGGSGADQDRTLRAAVGESGKKAVKRAKELVEENDWDSSDYVRLDAALRREGLVEDTSETSDIWDRLKSDGVIA